MMWLAAALASSDGLPTLEGPGVIAPVGDVDGDGAADVLVSDPTTDTAWLLVDGFTLDGVDPIEGTTGERFGAQLLAAGDVDGDGLQDFAIAAPDADTSEPYAGRVVVVTGSGTTQLLGAQGWDRIGTRLYAAGDVGGDGKDDLFVAAPWPTPNGAVGQGWVALVQSPEGVVELSRDDGFSFSSGSGFVHPIAESFFGIALAINDGTVWIAAPEADVAWRFDDASATASAPDAESPLAHGTSLTAFGEGVVGGSPEDSRVSVVVAGAAAPLYTGQPGDLSGWGVVGFEGRLVVSEPGFNDNAGRVVLLDQGEVVESIEGCGEAFGLGLSTDGEQLAIASRGAVHLYQPGHEDTPCADEGVPEDRDGDGFGEEDCDDGVAWVHPGANEVCDGVDDDCDGEVDEGCAPVDEGCGGQAWILLPLLLLMRGARAQDMDPQLDSLGQWLGGAEERLSGPVLPTDEGWWIASPGGVGAYYQQGEVFLLTDVVGTHALNTPTLQGAQEHERFGADLAWANGELLVGADHGGLDSGGAGAVHILSEGVPRLRLTGVPRDGLGAQVDAGDLDGDGLDEWVVAAPFNEGGGFWILDPLPVEGDVDVASLEGITGDEGDQLGWSLAVVDDLDFDGVDDLVVAARPQAGGQLIVYSRGERMGAWASPDEGTWLGWSLDGRAGRVVTGSPWAEQVWVLEGAPEGVQALPTPYLKQPGVGQTVADGPALLIGGVDGVQVVDGGLLLGDFDRVQWVPDVDADGTEDLVLFDSSATVDAPRQGSAWLVSGQAVLDGSLPAPDTGQTIPPLERPQGCSHSPATVWLGMLGLALLHRRS